MVRANAFLYDLVADALLNHQSFLSTETFENNGKIMEWYTCWMLMGPQYYLQEAPGAFDIAL
jgi:hypothetical protein